MPEELQHLINKIQKEGVDVANKQADEIIAEAKQQASKIILDAEKKANAKLKKADRDAKIFAQRGIQSVEQAVRDLLITVGQGVENLLIELTADAIEEAMRIEVIEQMLIKIAEGCTQQAGDSQLEFLIASSDKEKLLKYFATKLQVQMNKGLTLQVDNEVFKGFKVSMVKDCVYHDFSKDAIAEALINFLRPELSAIVHRVARETIEARKQME